MHVEQFSHNVLRGLPFGLPFELPPCEGLAEEPRPEPVQQQLQQKDQQRRVRHGRKGRAASSPVLEGTTQVDQHGGWLGLDATMSSPSATISKEFSMGESEGLEGMERLARRLVAVDAERTVAEDLAHGFAQLSVSQRASLQLSGQVNAAKRADFAERRRAGSLVMMGAHHDAPCGPPRAAGSLDSSVRSNKENSYFTNAPAGQVWRCQRNASSHRRPLSQSGSQDNSRRSSPVSQGDNQYFGGSAGTPSATEAQLAARLASMSRRMGTLRASCASSAERSALLDSELAAADDLLSERCASVLKLRARLAAGKASLQDDSGIDFDSAPDADDKAMAAQAPLLMEQLKVKLQENEAKLSHLNASISRLQVWASSEDRLEEQAEAEVAAARDAARAEAAKAAARRRLSSMAAALVKAEASERSLLQICSVRGRCLMRLRDASFEELTAIKASPAQSVLGIANDPPTTICHDVCYQDSARFSEDSLAEPMTVPISEMMALEPQCCHSVAVLRAELGALRSEQVSTNVQWEQVSGASSGYSANLEVARSEVCEIRAHSEELDAQHAESTELCSELMQQFREKESVTTGLAERVALQQQAVIALRRERAGNCHWKVQGRALEDMEARIAELVARLASTSRGKNEGNDAVGDVPDVAWAEQISSATNPTRTTSLACQMEAAQMLEAALSRIGFPDQKAEKRTKLLSGNSTDHITSGCSDLLRLATTTHAAACALRVDLAALVPRMCGESCGLSCETSAALVTSGFSQHSDASARSLLRLLQRACAQNRSARSSSSSRVPSPSSLASQPPMTLWESRSSTPRTSDTAERRISAGSSGVGYGDIGGTEDSPVVENQVCAVKESPCFGNSYEGRDAKLTPDLMASPPSFSAEGGVCIAPIPDLPEYLGGSAGSNSSTELEMDSTYSRSLAGSLVSRIPGREDSRIISGGVDPAMVPPTTLLSSVCGGISYLSGTPSLSIGVGGVREPLPSERHSECPAGLPKQSGSCDARGLVAENDVPRAPLLAGPQQHLGGIRVVPLFPSSLCTDAAAPTSLPAGLANTGVTSLPHVNGQGVSTVPKCWTSMVPGSGGPVRARFLPQASDQPAYYPQSLIVSSSSDRCEDKAAGGAPRWMLTKGEACSRAPSAHCESDRVTSLEPTRSSARSSSLGACLDQGAARTSSSLAQRTASVAARWAAFGETRSSSRENLYCVPLPVARESRSASPGDCLRRARDRLGSLQESLARSGLGSRQSSPSKP